jgi:hypothetical protein
MTLLLKDPDAVLDYMVDWGAEYLGGDAIAESRWEVSPTESGGAEVSGSAYDYLTATVQVSGGIPGKLYRVTNSIVTASGHEDRRSIMLRVEAR